MPMVYYCLYYKSNTYISEIRYKHYVVKRERVHFTDMYIWLHNWHNIQIHAEKDRKPFFFQKTF